MKKPNLPKQWNVHLNYNERSSHLESNLDAEEYGIVIQSSEISSEPIDNLGQNVAKVIDAVPDMIDALIEARHYVDSPAQSKRVCEKIEAALSKAGVTMNKNGDKQ